MAARTASVSGLWSNTATWGGAAVPVNADTVTINASVIVEFDVDQSGFAAGIGASTINGTFKVTNTAGTYYLKISGNWSFGSSSSFLANNGTLNQPLPDNVKFTVGFNGTFALNFNAATIVDIIASEPTHTYCKLSGAEAAAQTAISVDTDLTVAGDSPYWIAGNKVFIANINKARAGEEYTIQSVSSTEVTLTGGLSASKLVGAFMFLVERNIWFRDVSGSPTKINGMVNGRFIARTESFAFAGSGNGGSGNYVGGILYTGTSGNYPRDSDLYIHIINITNASIIGACRYYGVVASCASGLVGGSDGSLMAGIIAGCTQGINAAAYVDVTGEIVGCGTGVLNSYNVVLRGANLHDNTTDVAGTQEIEAYNTIFASATEYTIASPTTKFAYDYAFSENHDQVAGAYKAWTRGGNVTSTAAQVYNSRVRSYLLAPTSATFPVFMQQKVTVPAGATLYVQCAIYKDVSMTYLPRLEIFEAKKEPLISGSADASVQMTNSTATWELLVATVTNTTDAPKSYIVRTIAKNASGNVYVDPMIQITGMMFPMGYEGGLAA